MQQDSSSLKILLYISIILNIVLAAGVYYFYQYKLQLLSPLVETISGKKELPMQKYTYKNLHATSFKGEVISFGSVKDETEEYEVRMFNYEVHGKTVSGLVHLPKAPGAHPVLVMLRGYVDPAAYEPGIGSSPAARYFAAKGFITLAPDYFGYGESDILAVEPLEDRLITYTTVLQLLANIRNLNTSFENSGISSLADENNIGIWAHSNGGQIALSVLEASGLSYPTVLWAPVSKPFPYSVLYFTDDSDDHGRYLRKLIANFENDYDIESFSLTNYISWITAPIQLHQGGKDDAVPQKWSDQLVQSLKENNVETEYFVYSEADHNLRPDWDTAAQRSLQFYNKHFASP